MSAERAVHAAVRVRISLSDKLDGMLDQAAVGIEDEGAGEIPNQVAAERVELRGHEEQTSVAKAAHIVYVPFVGDEPDFFRRSVEYGFGVLATSLQFALQRSGISRNPIFSEKGKTLDAGSEPYYEGRLPTTSPRN